MNCADAVRLALAAALAGALVACGGSSSTTTITGPGGDGSSVAEAHLDVPTGDNTTQIIVDAGPSGSFAIGAVNVPYVTVTVCTPGSTMTSKGPATPRQMTVRGSWFTSASDISGAPFTCRSEAPVDFG